MANEFSTVAAHSAEYFGDTRDFWWNRDFLELMATRLEFSRVRTVLDVGCGVGHWGQLLAGLLPAGAHVTGVDRDPHWVAKAIERARACGRAGHSHYEVAPAEKLPFEDDRFDLVTCQTLLIHVPDPALALAEMARVTRPGGLILLSEPNNVATALAVDTLAAPVEELLALVRFQLVCERGKAALGEGHNSAGERIPGLLLAQGLENIRVHINDKTNFIPPDHARPEYRALLEEANEFAERSFWIWDRADTARYFIAGGGPNGEFENLWATAMEAQRRTARALANGTLTNAGGAIHYLIAASKPIR